MDWDSGALGNSPKTSTEWKDQGNKEFVAQKYEKALQSYTEGLKLIDDAEGTTAVQIISDILANRAAAYLKLDCFQSALEDTDKLLKIDPTHFHFKGLYRKGKALLGLQRFQEAIEFLELSPNLGNLDSENRKLWMELLELAENLLKQQVSGEYDMLKLYKAGEIRHNDCADFVGPVKVQEISGNRNGRGLFATQDIHPGQLISATKAFEIVFPEQEQGPSPWVAVFATPGIKVHVVNHIPNFHQKLVQKIVEKLTKNPMLCRTFYQLYAGPDFPIYDAEKDPLVVDEKRIEGICRYNTFVGNMPSFVEKPVNPDDPPPPDKSNGIWILPSFINHRCWGVNAIWTTFGDMMFVRAVKDIPIGSEILMSYVGPNQLYEEREKIITKHGFVCDCQICQIDRADLAEGGKRMELLKNIETHQKFWCDSIELEKLVKKFLDFEKKNKDSHGLGNLNAYLKLNPPSLILPMLELGRSHLARSVQHLKKKKKWPKFKTSAEWFKKAYDLSTQSPLQKLAVESCFRLIMTHLMDQNIPEAKKWVETLKKEMMTYVGTLDLAEIMEKVTLDFMGNYNIYL